MPVNPATVGSPERPFLNRSTRQRAQLFRLYRSFIGRFHHFVNDPLKLIKPGRRDDNVITPAIDVFRDAQEPPARIFLEGEQKCFALNLNFVAFKCIFLDLRARLTIRPPSKRRRSFI